MLEYGILARIEDNMLSSMPGCQEDLRFKSAKLEDVYSAFVLLSIFMIVSLAILLFECFWKHKQMTKNFCLFCMGQAHKYYGISRKTKEFTDSFHPDKQFEKTKDVSTNDKSTQK